MSPKSKAKPSTPPPPGNPKFRRRIAFRVGVLIVGLALAWYLSRRFEGPPGAGIEGRAVEVRILEPGPDLPLGAESSGAAAFAPDDAGKFAVAEGKDVVIREVDGGAEIKRLSGHSGGVVALEFARGGSLLASAGDAGGELKVWDRPNGVLMRDLAGHEGAVRALAFIPGSEMLASGGDDGTVRVWDLRNGNQVHKLDAAGLGPIRAVAASPDGLELVAGGGKSAAIWRWEVQTGRRKEKDVATGEGSVSALAYDPLGATLASVRNGRITYFELGMEGGMISSLWNKDPGVVSLGFGGGEGLLAAAGQLLSVWDLGRSTATAVAEGPPGGFLGVAFSQQGDRLITVERGAKARAWGLRPGEPR